MQRLFLSVLAGSQVSQLQGHSPATKAHAWNRWTEGDPQSFPVAQLRKRMFLPLCILGKKYLGAKKYHHSRRGSQPLIACKGLEDVWEDLSAYETWLHPEQMVPD